MPIEPEIAQRLNLIRSSPKFVLKDVGANGRQQVIAIPSIPSNSGSYWVGGKTILKCGRELESVFVVDTDSGGSLTNTFWLIGSQWHHQQDGDIFSVLGLDENQVFPYDWSYFVPLDKDIFH